MTMPSPERLARRSVALLARQGLPRGQAAEVIIHVCDDAAHRLYLHDHDADLTWLAALRAEARQLWQLGVTRNAPARLSTPASSPADRCSDCTDPQCPHGCNWANRRPSA